jgi:hypothetical protein
MKYRFPYSWTIVCPGADFRVLFASRRFVIDQVVQIKRLVPDRQCLKRAESGRWPNGGNSRDSERTRAARKAWYPPMQARAASKPAQWAEGELWPNGGNRRHSERTRPPAVAEFADLLAQQGGSGRAIFKQLVD